MQWATQPVNKGNNSPCPSYIALGRGLMLYPGIEYLWQRERLLGSDLRWKENTRSHPSADESEAEQHAPANRKKSEQQQQQQNQPNNNNNNNDEDDDDNYKIVGWSSVT